MTQEEADTSVFVHGQNFLILFLGKDVVPILDVKMGDEITMIIEKDAYYMAKLSQLSSHQSYRVRKVRKPYHIKDTPESIVPGCSCLLFLEKGLRHGRYFIDREPSKVKDGLEYFKLTRQLNLPIEHRLQK